MADDKGKEEGPEKKYKNMSRTSLDDIANEIGSMALGDEKFEHIKHAIKGYEESHVVEAEHREPEIEILTGNKAEQMQSIYKGVHEDHKKKKGNLEHKVTVDWMKKFADSIMPVMGIGAEGKTAGNYNTLKMYLTEFDRRNPRNKEGQTVREVMDLIKKGHGFEASAKIIEAIKFVKKDQELNNFLNVLIPPNDYEHRKAAAERIAKDVNAHLKKAKDDYRVSAESIGENIVGVYRSYAKGDFSGIKEYDKSQKGKD